MLDCAPAGFLCFHIVGQVARGGGDSAPGMWPVRTSRRGPNRTCDTYAGDIHCCHAPVTYYFSSSDGWMEIGLNLKLRVFVFSEAFCQYSNWKFIVLTVSVGRRTELWIVPFVHSSAIVNTALGHYLQCESRLSSGFKTTSAILFNLCIK